MNYVTVLEGFLKKLVNKGRGLFELKIIQLNFRVITFGLGNIKKTKT